jgi:ADP-L-glycero-D-manno-heptose 6-epimerase
MIVVTGAAGFIGSYVASFLAKKGYLDLILVDAFENPIKKPNYENIPAVQRVDRRELFAFLNGKEHLIQAIIHLGARTDTMEQDEEVFQQLNLAYSQKLWNYAAQNQIPFIYASSAATYGDGSLSFSDDLELLPHLKPLNPYARSKHQFDLWVLEQVIAGKHPFFWAGLKFFNVYGPNEYHKGRMASVVFHAFHQIQKEKKVRLFKSYKPEYAHGEQKRDFIYVKDVAEVIFFLLTRRPKSDIYNLGTGNARTFNDLVKPIFEALNLPVNIEYIDMPDSIRNTYQYFTEAKMDKLRKAGYTLPFTSIEEGVKDYVENHLMPQRYFA